MGKEELKNQAREMIAVALGFVASSLLIAIGVSLCLGEVWIGVLLIILGYEVARYTFVFLWKTQWGIFRN